MSELRNAIFDSISACWDLKVLDILLVPEGTRILRKRAQLADTKPV